MGGTIVAVSSQAPTTSLGQCTTSATRLTPTASAHPAARPTSSARPHRARAIGQHTITAAPAALAAAVVCPDGNDQPADGASWPTGRGRSTLFRMSSRTPAVTSIAPTRKQPCRHLPRQSSSSVATATTGVMVVVFAVQVTAYMADRQAGWSTAVR
jgi:hypothetical protein